MVAQPRLYLQQLVLHVTQPLVGAGQHRLRVVQPRAQRLRPLGLQHGPSLLRSRPSRDLCRLYLLSLVGEVSVRRHFARLRQGAFARGQGLAGHLQPDVDLGRGGLVPDQLCTGSFVL